MCIGTLYGGGRVDSLALRVEPSLCITLSALPCKTRQHTVSSYRSLDLALAHIVYCLAHRKRLPPVIQMICNLYFVRRRRVRVMRDRCCPVIRAFCVRAE